MTEEKVIYSKIDTSTVPMKDPKKSPCSGLMVLLVIGALVTLGIYCPWLDSDVLVESKSFLSQTALVSEEETRCLTFDEDLDQRVANASQIFITMPAKAAGTSLKTFTNKCTNFQYWDNFITSPNDVKGFLSASMDLPTIITSHIPDHEALTRLAQTSPNDVLNIFIYREESERKVSAIKHVVGNCFCADICWPGVVPSDYVEIMKKETGACIIESETDLIYNVIGKGLWEIGFDTNGILSCPLYEAIEDNDPNMIMVNFKEADKLQEVLARHHCPELMDELPYHINYSNSDNVWIRTKEDGQLVHLDDWAKSKQDFFDWAFDPTTDLDQRCQAKTRALEKQMLQCEDEIAHVSG